MNAKKRMTSIAGRINRSWLRRTILVLLFTDLLIAALAVAGWCYAAEEAAGGFIKDRERRLEWNDTLPFPDRLDSVTYIFENDSGQQIQVTGHDYFRLINRFITYLLLGEIIIAALQYGAGKRKARKLMRPLERMAETTLEMSRTRFDPEKLHTLETAIAGVSPHAPGARLLTGDKELQGLESAVNDLMDRMHAAYREQTRFVSDASHELRTPIAVIQGYADMLARWGKDDPKVLEEGIHAIRSESAHMNQLIEQLLFLARGDSGRTRMTVETCDLSAIMQEVHDEFRMIAPDRTWRLQAEFPITALCDHGMIKQSIRILTENAVKYTASGDTITLRTQTNKGTPSFEVQDNGIGIAEKDLPHIFDRFFRADPNRTRKTGGTGLGLSIAKWIIDQHGGYFDVLSRPEFGTRITVSLPQKPQEEIKA